MRAWHADGSECHHRAHACGHTMSLAGRLRMRWALRLMRRSLRRL